MMPNGVAMGTNTPMTMNPMMNKNKRVSQMDQNQMMMNGIDPGMIPFIIGMFNVINPQQQ